MKNLIAIILICCLLFVSGCSNVVSKHPIGMENYIASSGAWEGIWLSEDEVIKVKVIDESNGILKLAWIEDKDNDFKLATITCQIMKGENGLYLNVLEMPSEDFDGFYYWGKVKKENHTILFWLPSIDAFNEAYEAKKIKAIIEKTERDNTGKEKIKNIKLTDDPKVVLDLIESQQFPF